MISSVAFPRLPLPRRCNFIYVMEEYPSDNCPGLSVGTLLWIYPIVTAFKRSGVEGRPRSKECYTPLGWFSSIHVFVTCCGTIRA